MDDAAPLARATRRQLFMLAAILVLSAGLRLIRLGSDGLWSDECQTALFAGYPVSHMISAAKADVQAPLYYLLMHGVTREFGMGVWQLRAVSAVLGLLAILLAWEAGRRLVSPRTGVLVAFMLAVSPMAVHYSQEARNYALLQVLVLLVVILADRFESAPDTITGIGLAVTLAAVALTHDVGVFWVAGITGAFLVTAPWTRARVGRWALVLGGAAVLTMPWMVPALVQAMQAPVRFGWAKADFATNFPWQIPRSLAALGHGSLEPIRNTVRDIIPSAWVGLGLSVLLVAAGLRSRDRRIATTRFCLGLLLPLAALMLYAWATSSPVYLVGRVDSPGLPLLMLALATGADTLRPRIYWLVPVALTGLAILPLEVHIRLDTRSQEQLIVNLLERVRAPGDTVVTTHYDYCLQALGHLVPGRDLFLYPPEAASHPGWFDWTEYAPDHLSAEAATTAVAAARASWARGGRAVWLLTGSGAGYDTIRAAMTARLLPTGKLPLGYQGVSLERFGLPEGGAGRSPALPPPPAGAEQ